MMSKLFFTGCFFLLSSCGAKFPNAKISDLVTNPTATYLTDASTSYSVYGGYGCSCEHPGAHANFSVAGTYNIYAVTDGIIAQVEDCRTAGENAKYNIVLAIAMSGSVPVLFEYSVEPFGGTSCSSGGVQFSDQILVKPGASVKRGDTIARAVMAGSGAHVHFNLKADGATLCPEIFPTSVFAQTGALSSATCGTTAIASNTFCHAVTSSEDPNRLK
ncbi:hypothetical protein EBR78_06440 [bacterium]|nr:hypothetical protein [bacterium]